MRLRSWVTRLTLAATLGGLLAISGCTGGARAVTATTRRTPAPVVAGARYLALGDSVTFGFREPATKPAPDYKDARSFVGYPEDVGAALGLRVSNAACPGETSASFIRTSARSNGCLRTATGAAGYRRQFPLHVSYRGSQLQYAVPYLEAHPGVRVVSLMIGANDALVCQETTKDQCHKEFAAVLRKVAANVHDILATIRSRAGYEGQLVIVNYYSSNYASFDDDFPVQALNQAVDTAAKPFGAKIANGYQAFRSASVHSGLSPCRAGLLTQLTDGKCGIHPSVAGQAVLALAVERVLGK